MTPELLAIREVLLQGQRLSGQTSCGRRAPSKKSVPHLLQARHQLRSYVQAHDADGEAWSLLSLAEECLMNFGEARKCLEKSLAFLGRREHKALKRLALLKESESEWTELRLSPPQLKDLGKHLAPLPCDHTLRHTSAWIADARLPGAKAILQALRSRGGFCDCEVLANVVEA